MATESQKPVVEPLLMLNLAMYAVVSAIAGWAVNYSINETYDAASRLSYPLRLFPIYFPIGNMATGLFVLFALVAGVVGIGSSIAGILSIRVDRAGSWASGASFALVAWALTLLAMGLACKEIDIKGRNASLFLILTVVEMA
ncbi:hypothetical protein EJ110_NYTH20352 [Nymphaea thermarum]|nr:hypothetical protein EJ110_NYTH20352 [Nymphaea thermarum]